MKPGVSGKYYALFCAFALAIALLCGGCASSDDYSDYESDFFVPVDTLKSNSQSKDQSALLLSPTQIGNSLTIPGSQPGGGGESEWAPLYSRENLPTNERIPLKVLRDSLSIINEQIALLQNVLEASTIDQRMYFHSQVKAWRITNPVVRDSLFYTLMAVDSSMQSEAGTDAEVLATESNDLIEVRFGTSIFKGITLKQALEKSPDPFLYQKVIESSAYSKDVELRDTTFRLPTPLEPEILPLEGLRERFVYDRFSTPYTPPASADVSLYGLGFTVGPNWGGEVKIGNDEIGMPFWESGKMALMATYKQVKAGFELPMTAGLNAGDKFPLFPVRSRGLNGTSGIVGEFDAGSLGGMFSSTRLTGSDVSSLALFDSSKFYYISEIALGYFSFGFSLNPENFIRVKMGGGYDQVQFAQLAPSSAVHNLGQVNYNSYYMNVQYLHDVPDEEFGASLQFYDFSVMGTAWIDILPNKLSIKLKYSRIVSRPLRPWETQDFIIISPEYRWSF